MSTTSQMITSIEINKRKDVKVKFTAEKIQFKSETLTVTLKAQSDCCSHSYIFLPKDLNEDQYLGKIFDKLEETKGGNIEYDNYDYSNFASIEEQEIDRWCNDQIECKQYKVYFYDKTYFYILLKNYSNGYYTGWIESSFEDTALNELLQLNKALTINSNSITAVTNLIIVVGLPASGKTTYCTTNYPEYTLYDDYLNTIYNNTLLQHLQNTNNSVNSNSKVIINDPRLCDTTIFKQQVNNILLYIPLSNIQFILFENTPDQCILNSQLRNDNIKDINLKQQILTYSQNYDPYDEMLDYIWYIYEKSDIDENYKHVDVYTQPATI